MEELRLTILGPSFCLSFFSQPTHLGQSEKKINQIINYVNSTTSIQKVKFIFYVYLALQGTRHSYFVILGTLIVQLPLAEEISLRDRYKTRL